MIPSGTLMFCHACFSHQEAKRLKRSSGTETEKCYLLAPGVVSWPIPGPTEEKGVGTREEMTTDPVMEVEEQSAGNRYVQ